MNEVSTFWAGWQQSTAFLAVHVVSGYLGGAALAQLKANLLSIPGAVALVVLALGALATTGKSAAKLSKN